MDPFWTPFEPYLALFDPNKGVYWYTPYWVPGGIPLKRGPKGVNLGLKGVNLAPFGPLLDPFLPDMEPYLVLFDHDTGIYWYSTWRGTLERGQSRGPTLGSGLATCGVYPR